MLSLLRQDRNYIYCLLGKIFILNLKLKFKSDVGTGTIVGSAVFNILFIVSVCALAAKEVNILLKKAINKIVILNYWNKIDFKHRLVSIESRFVMLYYNNSSIIRNFEWWQSELAWDWMIFIITIKFIFYFLVFVIYKGMRLQFFWLFILDTSFSCALIHALKQKLRKKV